MKKMISRLLFFFFCTVNAAAVASEAGLSLEDPKGGLFEQSSKAVKIVYSIDWIVKSSAILFAVLCFVSSGNYARQGHYDRAAGAFIGGVISAVSSYVVRDLI